MYVCTYHCNDYNLWIAGDNLSAAWNDIIILHFFMTGKKALQQLCIDHVHSFVVYFHCCYPSTLFVNESTYSESYKKIPNLVLLYSAL